ncbi:MAG: hypothetical protein AAB671_00555 [Patescibacteria group bacterium]
MVAEEEVERLFRAADLVRQTGMHNFCAARELVGPEVFKGLLVGVVIPELPTDPRRRLHERSLAQSMVSLILAEVQKSAEAAKVAAG